VQSARRRPQDAKGAEMPCHVMRMMVAGTASAAAVDGCTGHAPRLESVHDQVGDEQYNRFPAPWRRRTVRTTLHGEVCASGLSSPEHHAQGHSVGSEVVSGQGFAVGVTRFGASTASLADDTDNRGIRRLQLDGHEQVHIARSRNGVHAILVLRKAVGCITDYGGDLWEVMAGGFFHKSIMGPGQHGSYGAVMNHKASLLLHSLVRVLWGS